MRAAHVRSRTSNGAARVDPLGAQAFERAAYGRRLEAEGFADQHEAERRPLPAAADPVLGFDADLFHRAEVTADAVLEHGEQQALGAVVGADARLAAAQHARQ